MPRGRRFAPSTENDGIWFGHRGCDDGRPLQRQKSTLTGSMLASRFNPDICDYPPDPPNVYKIRASTSFKTSNKFSAHDNRDVLASDAEYFGVIPGTRTTGRKLAKPELNQHLTDEKFLAHYGRQLTRYDYNTIYSDNYRGCQTTQPTMCCRSYPRQYLPAEHRPRPEQTGCLPPVAEDDNRPCRPTTEVLAITQMPFVRNTGAWKYSYNGIPRCYPAGFSQINDRNPYPGFFLRPQQTDNPANSICKATA